MNGWINDDSNSNRERISVQTKLLTLFQWFLDETLMMPEGGSVTTRSQSLLVNKQLSPFLGKKQLFLKWDLNPLTFILTFWSTLLSEESLKKIKNTSFVDKVCWCLCHQFESQTAFVGKETQSLLHQQ